MKNFKTLSIPLFGILLLVWVVTSLNIDLPNNLIADEFIYINLNHLKLSWIDFIFYNPKNFYGHGPLLPLFHTLLIKIGFSIKAIRIIHMSFLPIIVFTLIIFNKKITLSHLPLFLIILFHPTLWAQSSLLFPEVIQSLMGILIYLLWKRDLRVCLSALLCLSILLRESSLAFLFPIFILDISEKKYKKALKVYLPALIILGLHLALVVRDGSVNPGWQAYQSRGFLVESWNLLTTINYLVPPVGGVLLPLIMIFSLLGQISKVKSILQVQKKNINSFLISFCVVFALTLFAIETFDSSSFTLTKLIYRSHSLGLIGHFFILSLALLFSTFDIRKETFYLYTSSSLMIGFFLWYQAHAPREMLPPFIVLLAIFAIQERREIKGHIAVFALALFTLTAPFFKESELHPQRILNFTELHELQKRDREFLRKLAKNEVDFYFEDKNLLYLEDKRFSPIPLLSKENADKVLSMHPHHKGDLIDRGEALYLYKR